MAEEFLDLLQQGKTQQAHRFSQLKYVFPTPDTMLDPDKYAADKFMAEQLTPEDFEKFRETQTIKSLAAIDYKFTYQLDGIEPMPGEKERELFVLRYRITPDASAAKKRPFFVWIWVTRSKDPKSLLPVWKITDMKHTFKAER